MRKGLALMAAVSLFVFGLMTVTALAAEKGLSVAEKTFMKDAASSGLLEVELGKVAEANGSSQAVKDFAKMMQDDHSKANDDLKAVAAKKNLQLPAQLERKDKATLDKLSKYKGAQFDKHYMATMVTDHKKDIAMFKKASKTAKDPDLKTFVDNTLPTLEKHLEQAKTVAQQVGAKVK